MASHICATIFDTSPNFALGFCDFTEACVSLKKKAYADETEAGAFGSFFFLAARFGFAAGLFTTVSALLVIIGGSVTVVTANETGAVTMAF